MRRGTTRRGPVQPVYVSAGLAWESEERAMAERLLTSGAYGTRVLALVSLAIDMRDVYPPTHWAIRGVPPAYDTPDEDVYLEGRNVVLLSKASVFMARTGITRGHDRSACRQSFPGCDSRVLRPNGTARCRSGWPHRSPSKHHLRTDKSDVIRLGRALGVPLH